MESAKARLSQVGFAIREALDTECDPAEDVRVARAALLHAVTHSSPPRRPRGTLALIFDPRVVATFLAPVAAAAALFAWVTRPISFTVQNANDARLGDLVEASGREPLPLTFSEGSSVVLREGSRARVLAADASGARVLLESGEAEVSIQHRVGRKARWNVEAGPYRVLVTGTRFRVGWNASEQSFGLDLHEGNVVVSSNRCLEGDRVVRAVETLTLSCAAVSKVTSSAAGDVAPNTAKPEAAPTTANFPSTNAKASLHAQVAETEALDAFREPLAAGRFAEALRLAERADFARVMVTADRNDLLQLADAARLSGRVDRAVQALTTVRQRFAGSEEAANAAFSLGRIAFDQQKAYSEASRWFSAYLAEQPGGPLMGDAFGRLIEARERSGDLAGAQTDAERYLRRFPQGPYAAEARRILANAKE